MSKALAAQPDDPTLLMQRGYLHQRMRPRALRDFQAARHGQGPPTAILDEGYALSGVGDKRGAVDRLGSHRPGRRRQARPDPAAALRHPQQHRRPVARVGRLHLDRLPGRAAGLVRPGRAAITVPGDAVFSTAEIFWRPSDFLNSSTRTFELYGRLSNTLYNNGGKTASQTVSNPCGGGNIQVDETSNNGISGLPTTVGSLGMRFTPSTEVGLTFGLERQFNLGHAAGHVHATARRTALRAEHRQSDRPLQDGRRQRRLAGLCHLWHVRRHQPAHRPPRLVHHGRLCAGRLLLAGHARPLLAAQQCLGQGQRGKLGQAERDQAFGAGELRVGRSYRVDAISDRLVFFPTRWWRRTGCGTATACPA